MLATHLVFAPTVQAFHHCLLQLLSGIPSSGLINTLAYLNLYTLGHVASAYSRDTRLQLELEIKLNQMNYHPKEWEWLSTSEPHLRAAFKADMPEGTPPDPLFYRPVLEIVPLKTIHH